MPERKTRRWFIKTGVAAGAGVGAALYIDSNFLRFGLQEGLAFATSEEAIFRSEIASRSRLGLYGISPELNKASRSKRIDWGWQPQEFKNGFTETMKSYGMATQEEAQKILGDEYSRLIYGAELSSEPYGHYYTPSKRMINLARDIDQNYSINRQGRGWNFFHLDIHEIGHALDTRYIWPGLPYDYLLRIDEAKWQMLSETFYVTGNESGVIKEKLTDFKTNLGSEIAKRFVEGALEEALANPEEAETVKGVIGRMAQEESKDPIELKFNKRRSQLLGDRLLRQIGSGQIHLVGEINKIYQTEIDKALIEVFAEMFRLAVLRPEGIDNNPKIVDGAKKIISALRGEEVNLDQLRSQLFELSPEVVARNKYEREARSRVQALTIASPYEASVQAQEAELDREDVIYDAFIRGGRVPRNIIIPPDQVELLRSYGQAVSTFTNKELKLTDSRFPLVYAFAGFDPEMHLWEIRKVEQAVLGTNMRVLLKNLTKDRQVSLSEDQIKKIGESTQILEYYLKQFPKAS